MTLSAGIATEIIPWQIMAFKFERLEVWQRALVFSKTVHELAASFPLDERFVLALQMRRAADSVVLNIAEGSTGQTSKEFVRFIRIGIRSAIELVACLYLAHSRKLITKDVFDENYTELTIIIRMLQALKKSIEGSIDHGR